MPPVEPIWPPPPDLPHPLAGHDTFLTACIIETPTKMPLSRLRLVMLLRRKTGLDLRQCIAFVDYYCDRQAILMPASGSKAWLSSSLSLINFTAICTMLITNVILVQRQNAAATHSERIAISNERVSLDLMFAGLLLVIMCALAFSVIIRSKQTQRDTAEAREKMVLRKSMVGILQEAVWSEGQGKQMTQKQPGRD